MCGPCMDRPPAPPHSDTLSRPEHLPDGGSSSDSPAFPPQGTTAPLPHTWRPPSTTSTLASVAGYWVAAGHSGLHWTSPLSDTCLPFPSVCSKHSTNFSFFSLLLFQGLFVIFWMCAVSLLTLLPGSSGCIALPSTPHRTLQVGGWHRVHWLLN